MFFMSSCYGEILSSHLLSPMVLAFILGGAAFFLRSDLKFPEGFYSTLSIYLLLSLGIKGGASLAQTPFSVFWMPVLGTLCLGALIPVWCYGILRCWGKFSIENSAAIAAHYGSVSAVTFMASVGFMSAVGLPCESYISALVAVFEVPGIVMALWLAQWAGARDLHSREGVGEVLKSKSILLLVGGLLIGYISGPVGLEKVAPFFVSPFQGALVLFLLEMGMMAAGCLKDLKKVGPFLFVFALLMPVVNGSIGVWVSSSLLGFSLGGSTIFGAMAASASYIAAPAAVRASLPQANPAFYIAPTLAVTFPFNLSLGIPLYYLLASYLQS